MRHKQIGLASYQLFVVLLNSEISIRVVPTLMLPYLYSPTIISGICDAGINTSLVKVYTCSLPISRICARDSVSYCAASFWYALSRVKCCHGFHSNSATFAFNSLCFNILSLVLSPCSRFISSPSQASLKILLLIRGTSWNAKDAGLRGRVFSNWQILP